MGFFGPKIEQYKKEDFDSSTVSFYGIKANNLLIRFHQFVIFITIARRTSK
jgi:hypothetical protein